MNVIIGDNKSSASSGGDHHPKPAHYHHHSWVNTSTSQEHNSSSDALFSYSSRSSTDSTSQQQLTSSNYRAPMASLECLVEEGRATPLITMTDPALITRQASIYSRSGIKYRNLGKSGIRVSALGLGIWSTFGGQISEEVAEEILTSAYDSGINLYGTANVYAGGNSEILLGKILKKKNWKLQGPSRGLSRKYIIEALRESLERLQMSYVDVLLINKVDAQCPIEEIVRACTFIVNQGMAHYWGTSRWNATEIMECYNIARQCQLVPPIVEQTEYHMFQREKVEVGLFEVFHKFGVGTISWSPQAFGVPNGSFDEGVHLLSRSSFKRYTSTDKENESPSRIQEKDIVSSKVQELTYIAERLGCNCTQLTIAWCLRNASVHCVLIGAMSLEQLEDNIHAIHVVPKLTPVVMMDIERILENKPVRPIGR